MRAAVLKKYCNLGIIAPPYELHLNQALPYQQQLQFQKGCLAVHTCFYYEVMRTSVVKIIQYPGIITLPYIHSESGFVLFAISLCTMAKVFNLEFYMYVHRISILGYAFSSFKKYCNLGIVAPPYELHLNQALPYKQQLQLQ